MLALTFLEGLTAVGAVIGAGAAGAGLVVIYFGVKKLLSTPTSSPGGPTSIITLPPGAVVVTIPPLATVKIDPPAITAVDGTGTIVKVTVGVPATSIAGIPISVRLLTGSDQAMTSYLEIADPAGGSPLSGYGIDGFTTPPAPGAGGADLTFTIKAVQNGEEDILTIVVNPNGTVKNLHRQTFDFAFSTTVP